VLTAVFVDVSGDATTAEQMFNEAHAREPCNEGVTLYREVRG
jgi:hypothetical protein